MDEKTILPDSTYTYDEYRLITLGLVAVFNPLPDTNWIEEYIKKQNIQGYTEKDLDYRLDNEMYLKNPRYIKDDGQELKMSNDLRLLYTLFNYIKGTYGSLIRPNISGDDEFGLALRYRKDFNIYNKYYLDKIPDEEYKIRGFTRLTKFDSRLFYPKEINTMHSSKFDKVYWVTKRDGTDWIDDEEMNKASYKDLVYYDNLEEAKKHGKIVGYVTQVKNNEGVFDEGLNYKIYADMGISFEAKEGDVGQMITDSYWYFDENDGGDIKEGKFQPPASGKGYVIENRDYVKTKYDENGNKLSGTHAPKAWHSGNSLLIVDVNPYVYIYPDKATYNVSLDETIIKLEVKPDIYGGVRDEVKDKEKKIRVEVYLPKGIDYVPGTSKIKNKNIEPEDIYKAYDGRTRLTYYFNSKLDYQEFNSNIITLDTKVRTDFGDSRDIKFITYIKNMDSVYAKEDNSARTVYVSNLIAQVANKSAKQEVIDYGNSFSYSLKYFNRSLVDYKNVYMFDILPFNGDKCESKYNGTYSIGNIKSSNGSKMYYTNDTKIREYNAKNFKEAGVTWNEYTGGSLENVTAIYSVTDIPKKSDLEMTYDLTPKGAKAGDIYGNRLYTYVEGQADTIDTPAYKAVVAKRSIQGTVWKDINLDGKLDENEEKLNNVKVYLKDNKGNVVKRIDGSTVENVVTNAKGEYIFEDVPPNTNIVLSIDKQNGLEMTRKIADNKAGTDYKIKGITLKSADKLLLANYKQELKEQNFGLVPRLEVTAKKLWNGGKDRPNVTFVLYRNVEGGNKEKAKEQVLKTNTGTNEATYTFKDLDRVNSEGKEYKYTVDETNVPTNYTKSISEDGLTITNTYNSPKTKITATKKWQGGKDRNDITLQLYRNIQGSKKEFVKEQTVKTNEGENTTSYTFNELEETDKDGNKYTYTIDEKSVPENYKKSVDNNNYVVTNTYVSPKTELKVTKKWIGGKERNDIKVQLYRNGKAYQNSIVLKTDKGSNSVSYTFANLDKTDENGNDYTYTVDEVETPKNYVKSIDSKNNIITNTYVSPKVNVVATKKWIGGENARPKTITLALFRKVEGDKSNKNKEKVAEKEITVTKDPELKYEFKNLDETDKNGNKYVYTVEEINVPENYNKEETGLIVTNTYESPKIDIPVSKIYVNGGEKRKDVTIQLLRNKQKIDEVVFKVEKGKDTYTHTFKDLDKTDKSGKNYTYTVSEKGEVKDFVKRENGLSVTNEYVIPKIDISFAKKWNGGFEGKEKPRFEVQLYRDGNKYLDKVVIESKDKLEHTWKSLDRTDKNGKEYDYTVKEVLVPKYYKEDIKTIENNETKKKFEITNTFEMPKIDIVGKKIWNYGPDKKPDIEVVLLANGKKVDSIKVIGGKSDFVFKDKDIYDKKGNVIKYDIKENIYAKEYSKKNSLGYDISYTSKVTKKKVTDVEKNREFEITNTYNIPKKNIKGQKVWIGAGDNIPDITLTLFRNGKKYKDIVLKNGQKDYVFEDLDLADEKGNIYNYYVDEVEVPKGYTKKKTKTGDRIVNVKDEIGKKYIPYAGTKGGLPIIVLLGAVAYVVITRKKVTDKRNIGI